MLYSPSASFGWHVTGYRPSTSDLFAELLNTICTLLPPLQLRTRWLLVPYTLEAIFSALACVKVGMPLAIAWLRYSACLLLGMATAASLEMRSRRMFLRLTEAATKQGQGGRAAGAAAGYACEGGVGGSDVSQVPSGKKVV
jgi:hypothetical protein